MLDEEEVGWVLSAIGDGVELSVFEVYTIYFLDVAMIF